MMSRGKAYGPDRDYQILSRDVIQFLSQQEDLSPYQGDGIDVEFDMGGTIWTLDFALKSSTGKIVVGECRRWRYPIKQGHIAAFAYIVELIRKHTGEEVAGIYITRTKYQFGAIKAATGAGIEVAVCEQGQSPQNFVLSFQKYDSKRDARFKNVYAHVTETLQVTDFVSAKVIRAGGTIES